MTAGSTDRPAPAPRRSLRQDAINLPNLLTMLRVVLIPVVLFLLADGTPKANFWAAIVYIVCAVTDALDGWLARRRNLISILGKFLDPLADKLLIMSVLVFMVALDRVPTWVVILIIARELSITALRSIAVSEGVVIAAGEGGKQKTAFQMVAILLLILHHPYEVNYFFFQTVTDLHEAGLVLLYLSLVLALTSGGEYVKLLADAIEAKEKRLMSASSDDRLQTPREKD